MTETRSKYGFTDPAAPQRWDAAIPLPERRNNRKPSISHYLQAALLPLLFGFFKLLGIDAASSFMGKTMRYIGPLLKPVHYRGMKNLKLIYPDKTDAECHLILKNAWENLGRTVAEYAHLKKISAFNTSPRMTFKNEEQLRSLINSNVQVMFVSAHLANWETMPMALYQTGLRNAIVYRAANNPLVDEKIIKLRADVITRHQIPKGKRGGRAIVSALQDNLSLCMLVDQKLNSGIPSPFMGHDAMTAPATARLALKYNLPVIPLSVRRTKGAHFVITVHDAISFSPSGNIRADTQNLTNEINDALSNIIHAHPDQWLWFHNRWPKEATQDL